ncbi:MAG: T9SS type A sorting domain-containing protein [Bacteroidales bacterium]|nr:T9SS type A sorting domain-containing protein [Bacteroidales bacterium]
MKKNLNNRNVNKLMNLVYLFLGILFIIPQISFSQKGNKFDKRKSMHHEVPNDKYVPVSRESMEKSPAFKFKSRNIFTNQVNVDENGNNIVGDAANEPSIAFDPTNPNRIVIGWRQFDNINNDFRQAGYGYSTDAGQNWTFPGVIDPGVFRSDPVLDFDSEGNFYYNSLTVVGGNDYVCDVYRIMDGGYEWDDGVFAQGGDKQWMRIDKTDGIGAGNNYSFWTAWYSTCYPGFFTRSTNGGNSYEDCVTIPGDPQWGTLAVGPEGELYIVGAGYQYDILVAKSTTAQNPGNTVSWDSYNPVNLDGELTGWSNVNPAGLVGQAWIDVDVSNGPGHGNVYVLASVERFSNNDPADVMFAKSTNGGQTFGSPIRINTDVSTNNYQWFGTMSVAPNGRIDAIWLDTRDATGGSQYWSALYYSYSTDQGETWSENEKLSESFDPHVGWPQQEKMGDYFDMKSDNGGAHLAWANTLNGGQDVYYSYITSTATETIELNEGFQFISSNIDMEEKDMTVVMAEVLNDNLDFVRSSQGTMLRKIGPNWVNGIGDWTVEEGYLVKMNADDSFTIEGDAIDPSTPIQVVEGFQFVSYFPDDNMDALLAFETIIGDDLDFIRNSQGSVLRKIGPNWVNGIGDCYPGEGYLVKMTAEGEIVYPTAAKSSAKIKEIPTHFNFKGGNAADPVFTIYITGLEIGDEVAAYDGDILVGACKISSMKALDNDLPVFNTINSGQGYIPGNPITLKVWSNNQINNADFTMEEVFDSYEANVYPEGDGQYSLVKITKDDSIVDDNVIIFPNPATHEINISSSQTINNILILNNLGQVVYKGKSEKINTSNFNSGIYIVRIKTDKGITTKKFSIK